MTIKYEVSTETHKRQLPNGKWELTFGCSRRDYDPEDPNYDPKELVELASLTLILDEEPMIFGQDYT
jgi:hypothetical protein